MNQACSCRPQQRASPPELCVAGTHLEGCCARLRQLISQLCNQTRHGHPRRHQATTQHNLYKPSDEARKSHELMVPATQKELLRQAMVMNAGGPANWAAVLHKGS